MQRKVRILAIYDHTGPSFHRIFVPLAAMDGVDVTFTNIVGEGQPVQDFSGFDVVMVNRMFPANKLSEVLKAKEKHGFKLIVDMDDHWQLGPDHYLYEYYQKYQLSTYILTALIKADAVTVTHERLADAVAAYNRNVWILPNAIDPLNPSFQVQRIPGNKTRLFWAGGITHEKDISLLKGPVQRICSDNYLRANCMMVMGGFDKTNDTWQRMASNYTNGLQMPGFLLEGKQVNEYYKLYQYADICLIPLQETKFNSFKSNLKILEAAHMGLPVVVSKVHPYLDFPSELVNFVEKQKNWYINVRMLVRDSIFAKEQGEALKQYCNQVFNFDKINEARWTLIQQLASVTTS